jgi:hypothetical protein
MALRRISSKRSVRSLWNLGWENSQISFSFVPLCPLGDLLILWKPYLCYKG